MSLVIVIANKYPAQTYLDRLYRLGPDLDEVWFVAEPDTPPPPHLAVPVQCKRSKVFRPPPGIELRSYICGLLGMYREAKAHMHPMISMLFSSAVGPAKTVYVMPAALSAGVPDVIGLDAMPEQRPPSSGDDSDDDDDDVVSELSTSSSSSSAPP